jgi:hypothetical protein
LFDTLLTNDNPARFLWRGVESLYLCALAQQPARGLQHPLLLQQSADDVAVADPISISIVINTNRYFILTSG